MAGSVNKVILIGNLGRDPEVRHTQDGNKIVHLSLATSETWRDKNSGERRALDGPQTAMHQESTPPGLVVTCSETPPRKPYSARRATVRWQRIFPRANAIPPEA